MSNKPLLDPFQTPLSTNSQLPDVLASGSEGVREEGGRGRERVQGREEGVTVDTTGTISTATTTTTTTTTRTLDSRLELGEPISLDRPAVKRTLNRPVLPTPTSSSSSTSDSTLPARKNPSDLFFYTQPTLSTTTPRPSPPRGTAENGHDDDDDEDDRHDHADSDCRTDLGLDPRSTPWGPGALTSDTGLSHGSPADTELRTPGLDSSVFPLRRLGVRAGIVHHRRHGEEGDGDEDEEADGPHGREDGRKKGGNVDWKMFPPRGLETPAPAPGNRTIKDLSAIFPFALSTPQNTGSTRRGSDKEEKELQLEIPLQPQPLGSQSETEPLPEREGQGRSTVSSPALPLGPLSTPLAIGGSPSTRLTPEVGSSSMSMSTGKKRRRTSPEELMVLEEAYERNQLPTSEERSRLAGQTGMSARAVQIWFQNKRQTEKRKANQKVFPTLMLVPLRPGSASEPSSEGQSEETSRPFLLPTGKRSAGSRSPTMSGYQYVPAGISGEGQASAVSKGKRPVLPGDQEEDTFFTSGKTVARMSALQGKGKAVDMGDTEDDQERGLAGAETETELYQGDHEVDELEDDDEGITRGRSRDAVLPTSDIRSSSPALIRSSSPVVLLKERQQLKRRGSSADDKNKKEQDAKREKLMLFPSSSSISVELSGEIVAATPTQTSSRSDGTRKAERASPATALSTPKSQESSRSSALKRTASERIPGSLKRQIIGIADISAGDQLDASPSAPFSGRKFVVTQSVPSFSVRRDGAFAKPVSPLGKRKFSRFSNGYPIRSDLPTPGKSFGRSQSGILDEMCSRKELPFLPSSARKEMPGTPSAVASSEPEDHVKVESEIMLSQSKMAMVTDNSLLDLLPSDPPSMGLIDLNSDAEDAPFEGDTDVEETPKKKMRTRDGSHGSGLRQFASLDYFAGSPSKRKGLLGDESRRLSGLGTARRRLFEAHLQQQAQQRASLKAKKQSSSKKKKKAPASGLKRSESSSSASIALATIAATPTRKPLVNSHSMPDLALVTSEKVNRRVRASSKDGKAEQQTDEEAARLLLGLFGGRS